MRSNLHRRRWFITQGAAAAAGLALTSQTAFAQVVQGLQLTTTPEYLTAPTDYDYIGNPRPKPKARARIDHIATLDAAGNFKSVVSKGDLNTPIYSASLIKSLVLAATFDAISREELSRETAMELPSNIAKLITSTHRSRLTGSFIVDDAILMTAARSYNDIAYQLAVTNSRLPMYADEIAKAAAVYPNEDFRPGDEYSFCRVILQKLAQQIGMTNTWVANAHGLPLKYTPETRAKKENVSSAGDLLLLTRHIVLKHPEFLSHFSMPLFKVEGTTKLQINTNNLLHDAMSKYARPHASVRGGKTGLTNNSGACLIVLGEINGQRIVGITTGHPTVGARDDHMHKLLDEAARRIPKPATTQTLIATPG